MKDQRADRDTERLRQLLAKATPAAPDPQGRAARVEAQAQVARKRIRTFGAMAAVGAVAAVIISPSFLKTNVYAPDGATGSGDDPQVTASSLPSAATSTSTDPTHDLDPLAVGSCPVPEVQRHFAELGSRPRLSSGAASIRLCAPAHSGVTLNWVAPRDALVIGVDEFVSTLNARDPADPDRCRAVRPALDPYFFRVSHVWPPASQSEIDVPEQTLFVSSMCTDIIVDGTPVESDVVLDGFFAALAEQRSQLAAPKWTDISAQGEDCERASNPTRLPPDLRAVLAAGVICFSHDQNTLTADGDHRASVLSADQVRLLSEDMFANARAGVGVSNDLPSPACADDCDRYNIRLTNEWGDVVGFSDLANGFYHSTYSEYFEDQPDLIWKPRPETIAMIRDAIDAS